MKSLNKLKLIVKLWGGNIKCVDNIPPKLVSPFSGDVGCDWDNKIIYYTKDCNDIFEIIHEAGHVFASTLSPNKLKRSFSGISEYDFLGWEFAMTEFIGLKFSNWLENNKDYSVSENPAVNSDDVIDVKYMSKEITNVLYLERLNAAKVLGLVSKNNIPLCVRI